MNSRAGKARIGLIAILSMATLVMAGLYRSSDRADSATQSPALAGQTLFLTDDESHAVTAYPVASNGDVSPTTPAPTGLSQPQFSAVDANGNIYVTNPFTMSVTIYAKGSNGNVTPFATIGGSNTGLNFPEGIALDSSGNIYVTNCAACNDNTGTPSITVYSALTGSSSGLLNVAPIATITGSNTGLMSPEGIAVDSSSGNIFVADSEAASVFEYSAGSNGNVAPSATISGGNTGLMSPTGITERAGGDIYVADSVAVSVFVFSAGSTGNISPAATISGGKTGLNKPLGIALDSSLNIYVANSGPSVTIYSDGSSGNSPPTATIKGDKTDLDGPVGVTADGNNIYVADETSSSVTIYPAVGNSTGTLNEAPSAAISTTLTTGLIHPQEIVLNSDGNIYIADDFAAGLFVYPAGSNGNAVPTAIISGGMTNLTSPYGIALDATANIYVADYGLRGSVPASVFVFPPIASSTGTLNEAPSSTISGQNTGLVNPFGIALDSSRNIYVADDGNSTAKPAVPASVFVYSAGSHGDAAPLATISGSNTGLMEPCGVALDSTGNIYVADFSAASVFVYSPLQTSGTGLLNENPTVTIKDSQHLSGPCGITLDSSSNIYVADSRAGSVFAYPAVGGSTGTINDSPMSTISGPLTELAEPLFAALQPPPASPTPSPTATATQTGVPTATPTPTLTATATATQTPIATPTPGTLSISPSSINFGQKTAVGRSSKAAHVTIKNTGKKKVGAPVSVTMETASPSVFTVTSQCAKTLAPGKKCKVSVIFRPLDDTTEETGSMMIFDNAAGSPQSVGLSGIGKAPKKKK